MAVRDNSNLASTCPKNTATTAPINAMPRSSRQMPQQYNSHRHIERPGGEHEVSQGYDRSISSTRIATSCPAKGVSESRVP